ncbi:MAG: hypothetical protein NTU80_04680 [Verrucomicrobia bacterium]|nr:hypothetical protein [Verrucomicrobiota bacterium]
MIALAPELVFTWQAVADLARLRNDPASKLRAAQKAAELAPDRLDLALALCGATLFAGDATAAARILDAQPPGFVSASDYALRLRGEIARRAGRWTEAAEYFTQAQKYGDADRDLVGRGSRAGALNRKCEGIDIIRPVIARCAVARQVEPAVAARAA